MKKKSVKKSTPLYINFDEAPNSVPAKAGNQYNNKQSVQSKQTKSNDYKVKIFIPEEEIPDYLKKLKIYIETNEYPILGDFAIQNNLSEKRLLKLYHFEELIEMLTTKLESAILRNAAEGILKPQSVAAIFKYLENKKLSRPSNIILEYSDEFDKYKN